MKKKITHHCRSCGSLVSDDGVCAEHPNEIVESVLSVVPVLFRGFEASTLRAAFDALANPADWRAPIDATIDVLDFARSHGVEDKQGLSLAFAAIVFFTSSEPCAHYCGTPDAAGGEAFRFHITAAGYRNGPAGP